MIAFLEIVFTLVILFVVWGVSSITGESISSVAAVFALVLASKVTVKAYLIQKVLTVPGSVDAAIDNLKKAKDDSNE